MKIVQYEKLKEKLDTQLQKIEAIADQKAEEIEQNYFYKYKDFFEIALRVLKKYPVLLYGGTAINEVLPKKFKIYKEDELPDVDIFCKASDYEKISEEILKTFEKQGYKLTTIKEALHKNTYKVMVEGLQLIDISVIDTEMFRILSKGKQPSHLGVPIVSVDYLKYSLHLILSQSLDAHRWPKVFQRLVRLYETHPLSLTCTLSTEDYYLEDIPKDLVGKVKEYAYNMKMVGFGWDVIQHYLKEDDTIPGSVKDKFYHPTFSHPIHYFVVPGGDVWKEAYGFQKYLQDKDVKIVRGNRLPFLPEHVILTYKGDKWIYLFQSVNCSSYMEYKKSYVFSIHSMIQYLYLLYFGTQEEDIYCVIQILVLLQINNSLSKKKLFQQFVLQCHGYQKGLVTLRKERFARILKNKNQSIQ